MLREGGGDLLQRWPAAPRTRTAAGPAPVSRLAGQGVRMPPVMARIRRSRTAIPGGHRDNAAHGVPVAAEELVALCRTILHRAGRAAAGREWRRCCPPAAAHRLPRGRGGDVNELQARVGRNLQDDEPGVGAQCRADAGRRGEVTCGARTPEASRWSLPP